MKSYIDRITFIQITTYCNARCLMCDFWKKSQYHMPFPEVVKILESISIEHPNSEIRFTGGEPCLHPKFEKIVEEAISRKLSVSIITNGSLFLKEITCKKNLFKIFLSIDSPEINEQTRIRGIGIFSVPKIYENITFANVIVSKLNQNSILLIPEWLIDKGINKINLIPMKTPNYMLPPVDLNNILVEVLKKCNHYNINHFVECIPENSINSETAIQLLSNKKSYKKCKIGSIIRFIDINYRIFYCNSVPHYCQKYDIKQFKECYCDDCMVYSSGCCDFSNILYNSLN